MLEWRGWARRRARHSDTTLDSLVRGDARAGDGDEGVGPSIAFCLQISRALLSWGMPAHRVEDSLERLADALDLDIDVFSTPTAILATLGDAEQVITRVVRVQPGGTDLERLSALHDLVGRVERHELTPGDASRRLEVILSRPPRYGRAATTFGYCLISTAAAVLLGGSLADVPVAAGLGVMVGVLDGLASKFGSMARLLPALAATIASVAGTLAATAGLPVHGSVVLLAGVIVLLPGFTLTTAMMELASAHLVSGTARLAGASVTFLQLAFGVALGRAIASLLPAVELEPWPALPELTLLAAPLISALGFGILLKARPAHALPVLAAAGIALAGSRLGGRFLGPELGAFVGALMVASAAHFYARERNRPISVMLVPGILFMVPGSVGFLSVSALLENDPVGAITTAFRMFLIAMALASGTIVASAAVPPRRAI